MSTTLQRDINYAEAVGIVTKATKQLKYINAELEKEPEQSVPPDRQVHRCICTAVANYASEQEEQEALALP